MWDHLTLNPTSYDMPNGYTGSYNYWDKNYSGTGSVSGAGPMTANGESLSGGLGDLTDGVIAANNWYIDEPPRGGEGPYVGWLYITPIITFNFGETVVVDSMTLYLDDANGYGGVNPPASVDINGTNYLVTDPASGAPFSVTFSGLNAIGSSLTLQLMLRLAHIPTGSTTTAGHDKQDFGSIIRQRYTP